MTQKMQNYITPFLFLTIMSCAINYPPPTFYVKNNSERTIDFTATVIKHSSMGPFEMTLPFTVLPMDSVVARRVGFKKDIQPNRWFLDFSIFPIDSLVFNDPNDSSNWIKTYDDNANPIYTFKVIK